MAENMESDLGKLFIGGISWDTDEDRLKEYFSQFGEVIEAVIMRDRNTGRARGFGFVIFVEPAVAERVVMEKHMIDGRTVEAKKAVPKDDRNLIARSIQGSPGPGRTKKIFVGGLASTVNENDFKNYFEQFGTISDVVVMYDHNTHRPRGFGFITYESEDAVDSVLHKTHHELNGKMVEVKRAIPKELSPGPNRSPLLGYNFGLNRANSLLSSYAQGYNLNSAGGFGARVDSGRFGQISSGHTGLSQFGYGIGMNLEPSLSPRFVGNSVFSNNLGYGRPLSPYISANSNRYNIPIGYNASGSRSDSFISSPFRNIRGNGGVYDSPNNANSGPYLGNVSSGFGMFGINDTNWGSSVSGGPLGANSSGYGNENTVFRGGENSYDLGSRGLGRNNGIGRAATSTFSGSNEGYNGSYGGLYRSGSVYSDPTWQSASTAVDGSSSFGYGLGNSSNVPPNDSEGYVEGYSTANRQPNRGIAA